MLLLAVAATTPVAAPPDLRGEWRLNEELSDDVFARFQKALDEQPRHRRTPPRDDVGGGPGVGGISGSAGGFPLGGTTRTGQRDPGTILGRMKELMDGYETLSINYEEPILSILLADGRHRSFRTDGKKKKENTVDGMSVTSAKWKKDGRLVINTSTAWGREMTETLELLPGTGQLSLTTELYPTAGMPAVSVRRIYDREAADGTGAAADASETRPE